MPKPSPPWFSSALLREPERKQIISRGTELELLTWGDVGKPGLIFVHGATAQADWWSFIAPYFADEFRVAAFSLPGMGRSGWRARYAFQDFPEDAAAVVEAACVAQSGELPIFVAHSFGGSYSHFLAAHHPDRLRGLILIDSALRATSPDSVRAHNEKAGVRRPAGGTGIGRRVYQTSRKRSAGSD